MRLAANLTWLYRDREWPQRFSSAAADGFAAAEILLPYDHPPQWYAEHLRSSGLELVLFNTPIQSGRAPLGWAALPGEQDGFRAAFDQARAVAEATGCRRIHVMAGHVGSYPTKEWKGTLVDNLEHAVRLAETDDLTLTLEALNREDMEGYAYHYPAQVIEILQRLSSPRLRLQFDYYHCAKERLDLMGEVRSAAPWIGYVQIANAEGRVEPELGVAGLLKAVAALPELGYDDWLGCEYRPRTTVAEGLQWCMPLVSKGILVDEARTAEEQR